MTPHVQSIQTISIQRCQIIIQRRYALPRVVSHPAAVEIFSGIFHGSLDDRLASTQFARWIFSTRTFCQMVVSHQYAFADLRFAKGRFHRSPASHAGCFTRCGPGMTTVVDGCPESLKGGIVHIRTEESSRNSRGIDRGPEHCPERVVDLVVLRGSHTLLYPGWSKVP